MRPQPMGSVGHEEPSLWDPPCRGLAAPQPVPAPCRVTAAAPARPGACSGRGHGARRGRAGLWGMGCCGAGVPDPSSPSAPISAPVALPCSRVMASTSCSGGPRLRTAPHSSLGGAGLGWEALHLAPCQLGTVHALHPSLCPPSPSAQPGPCRGSRSWGLPRTGTHSSAGDSGLSGSGYGSTIVGTAGSGLASRRGGGYLWIWGAAHFGLTPPTTAPHCEASGPCAHPQPHAPPMATSHCTCACPHENATALPSPARAPIPPPPSRCVPPVPVGPRPGGGPGRWPQQQDQDQHHRRLPHPATWGCGGTRAPGSGGGGRARGNPALGQGRGLRELPGRTGRRGRGAAGNAERPVHPPGTH